MKKLLSLLLCLVLAVGCISILAGCEGSFKEPVPMGPEGTTWEEWPEAKSAPAGVVKRYFWDHDDPKVDDIAVMEKFRNEYGGDLQYTIVNWENMKVRLLSDIATETPPDLCYMAEDFYPTPVIYGNIMPVKDIRYKEVGDPDSIINKYADAARKCYSWNGEPYAVARAGVDPVMLYYNKTMFENYGQKTPGEYFEDGEWNWDTFEKCAGAMTMDLNGDKVPDVYGYGSWRYDVFLMANGGNFVRYNDDGTIDLTMDDPKTVKGLEFFQKLFFTKEFIHPDGHSGGDVKFEAGKIAMYADPTYVVERSCFQNMKDEWDMVPFPLGPDNDDGRTPGNIEGWGITTGAKNIRGAVVWMMCSAEYGEENMSNRMKLMTEDQREMIHEMEPRVFNARYRGIGRWYASQWDFWADVWQNGEPIATAIKTHEPTFLDIINSAINTTEAPELTPMEIGKPLEFESDADMSVVLNVYPGESQPLGTDLFEITNDPSEVIAGNGSLKITRKNAAPGEEDKQLLLYTDPEKWKIPAFAHTYRITIDYTVISDPGPNPEITIGLRDLQSMQDGKPNTFLKKTFDEGLENGESGKWITEGSIDVIEEYELAVFIEGFYTPDFVIDNIQIEEITRNDTQTLDDAQAEEDAE